MKEHDILNHFTLLVRGLRSVRNIENQLDAFHMTTVKVQEDFMLSDFANRISTKNEFSKAERSTICSVAIEKIYKTT